MISRGLQPAELFERQAGSPSREDSAHGDLGAARVDFPSRGLQPACLLEGRRMISHLGTSPCGALWRNTGRTPIKGLQPKHFFKNQSC